MNKKPDRKFAKKLGAASLVVLILAIIAAAVAALLWYLHGVNIPVLDPQGLIAQKERNLLLLITGLSMIVIVPVFVLTIFIAWKYREGNTAAKHSPDWDRKPIIEIIWWAVPTILIAVFSVITWNSTHDLDPYKPIASNNAPIEIQVVALDWKWLFIYPQLNIASVNQFEFPENTPVNFEITSDAPMNSFWIPALGSQIYAMPSMSTQLHLIASSTGSYYGSSANISGAGFASMAFTAKSVSDADFSTWVQSIQQSANPLTVAAYNVLAQPSSDTPVEYFSWNANDLYDRVMMKDMMEESEVLTDASDANDTMSSTNATGTSNMMAPTTATSTSEMPGANMMPAANMPPAANMSGMNMDMSPSMNMQMQ